MMIESALKYGTTILRNIYLKIRYGNRYKSSLVYSCGIGTKIKIRTGGGITIGEKFCTMSNATLSALEHGTIVIGNRVSFNRNVSIACRGKITIGDDVIFGPNCQLFDHDHDYNKLGQERRNSIIAGDITIGNGVWFGANCIILRGTTIGDNCVFGAGSIIKGNYEANVVVTQERNENKKYIKTAIK